MVAAHDAANAVGNPVSRAAMNKRSTRRPEIDGLRGLAVLLVVLFHAGVMRLQGGFIGVDVFFVISGFVITGALLRELESDGTIDLSVFYARRVRRIVPIASIVIAITVLASVYLLPITTITDSVQAGISASLFAGNIFFANQQADYFANSSVNNPLLHYWSLGVEEQFYLIWPAAMVLTWHLYRTRFRVALTRLLILVSTGSLAYCILLAGSSPSAVFFLLPARAFELAAGALLALFIDRIEAALSDKAATFASVIGFVLIMRSAIALATPESWTLLAALIPVVGTLLVIAGGKHGAGWWLSSALMEGIGNISFSLYLIHWPVLTIMPSLFGHSLNLTETFVLLMFAAAAALTSVRYLERPIRYSIHLNVAARRGLAVGAAGVLLSLSISNVAGLTSRSAAAEGGPAATPDIALFGIGPQPNVVPSNLSPTLEDASNARRDALASFKGCFQAASENTSLPNEGCFFGASTPTSSVALLGDSHAAHWFPALSRLGAEHEFSFYTAVKAGCPAVGGLIVRKQSAGILESCQEYHDKAVAFIKESGVKTVILASSTGYLFREGVAEEYLQKLQALIKAFEAEGIASVVLGDSPTFSQDIPTCLSVSRVISSCSQRAAAQEIQDLSARERSAVESSGARYLATEPLLCPTDTCPLIVGNLLIYLDSNHLAPLFSTWFAPILGKELLPLLRLE